MQKMLERFPFLSGAENRESFFRRIALFLPASDHRHKEIERAYNDAKDAFRGRSREGGERYFEHLRAVALFLVEHLRVRDHHLIIAALLHDVVEDIPQWTIGRVRVEYGDEVALLLDYLSKPPEKDFSSREERDRVYHARFEFAPRAFFLIKLSDRLHNLLTLGYCPAEKRKRKIAETRWHYLPYAEKQLILLHEIEETLEALGESV